MTFNSLEGWAKIIQENARKTEEKQPVPMRPDPDVANPEKMPDAATLLLRILDEMDLRCSMGVEDNFCNYAEVVRAVCINAQRANDAHENLETIRNNLTNEE